MKIKIFITCLFFLFSANGFAEWIQIGNNEKNNLYIDSERIRKDNFGHVFFYILVDDLYKGDDGIHSTIAYYQGDCEKFSYKILKTFFHRKPMGIDRFQEYVPPKPEWDYVYPQSGNDVSLKYACKNF